MKKIKIDITKAQLKRFSIEFSDEIEITATIELLTSENKKITEYTIYTHTYSDDDKFDLPIQAIQPIKELAKILETVVVLHCNKGQKMLGNKNRRVRK